MLKELGSNYQNLAGIVVMKDGNIVEEQYYNDCDNTTKIHIFSVTKSIVSLLIGIAIDKGHIKSVDQKVLDFFPDYKILKDEKCIQNITLRQILTMSAPYKYTFAPYVKFFTSDDWVKSSLDLLGSKNNKFISFNNKPYFRYTPVIGPDILSGIITNSTGKSVIDFARENLFSHLTIDCNNSIYFKGKEDQMAFYKAKNVNGWVADSKGINTAGWGLSLTTKEMAAIGQLCLNNGSFNGKQIVSSEWINEISKKQNYFSKFKLGYGYLWWVIDESLEGNTIAAMGDGGNTIYINKAKNLVISISSLFVPRAKDRIELIKKYIEPNI